MVAGTGGRERTSKGFQALLTGAGPGLKRIIPLALSYNVVEGLKA